GGRRLRRLQSQIGEQLGPLRADPLEELQRRRERVRDRRPRAASRRARRLSRGQRIASCPPSCYKSGPVRRRSFPTSTFSAVSPPFSPIVRPALKGLLLAALRVRCPRPPRRTTETF